MKNQIQLVSGRSINETQKSKYKLKDSDVFNKSQILYGLDRASETIKLKSQAIVVEGYFDCISGYEKGYKSRSCNGNSAQF